MSFEEFLKEASYLLGLQWRAFSRKGIKRRLEKRIKEIGLANLKDYFFKIKEYPQELEYLSKILTITISRFFRDQVVFNKIETFLIPSIIETHRKDEINIWSIGCASGEEPYSIALIWKESLQKKWPHVKLSILATDIDQNMIKRAMEGRYKWSSLKEVPERILKKYFKIEEDYYILDKFIRETVIFKIHNIIKEKEFPNMDIILCRNLAFTYFSKSCQINVLKKIDNSLIHGGYLVIGKDENLPLAYPIMFTPIFPEEKIYKKFSNPSFIVTQA